VPKITDLKKEDKGNGKSTETETDFETETNCETETKEELSVVVHPTVVKWNEFIEHLLEAKRLWAEMNEELPDRVQREIVFPYQAQLIFSMFEKQDFTVMLPRFTDYFRGYGGLESMKV
jgi:hypothetical protein